jgi:hypothetical protein
MPRTKKKTTYQIAIVRLVITRPTLLPVPLRRDRPGRGRSLRRRASITRSSGSWSERWPTRVISVPMGRVSIPFTLFTAFTIYSQTVNGVNEVKGFHPHRGRSSMEPARCARCARNIRRSHDSTAVLSVPVLGRWYRVKRFGLIQSHRVGRRLRAGLQHPASPWEGPYRSQRPTSRKIVNEPVNRGTNLKWRLTRAKRCQGLPKSDASRKP